MRKPKLSKAKKREAERKAAEEFFRRRSTPPTQFRSLESVGEPSPQPVQAPSPGVGELGGPASLEVTDWRESQALLKRLLAEGKIK